MTQSTFETKAPTFIFHKDLFSYNGGYLMYGNNIGDQVFIARFKYGKKNWRTWANFLCKNFTVAEYLKAADKTSPREAIEAKGFYDDMTVAMLRAKLEIRENRIKELEAK
tara:strand:+ start:1144 stop:1473 length:330 start_codon:yes stop_codon:yes gene_type:complete